MNPDPNNLPPTPARYTLQTVTRITGVNRQTLIRYCEQGLLPVPPAQAESAEFDDHLVCAIRRIEFLRETHGVNPAGIRMINDLLAEVEQLQRELRFMRDSA